MSAGGDLDLRIEAGIARPTLCRMDMRHALDGARMGGSLGLVDQVVATGAGRVAAQALVGGGAAASADLREGLAAFCEKRRARFATAGQDEELP